MSDEFKKRYPKELCIKELEKAYEISVDIPLIKGSDYCCFLIDYNHPTIKVYNFNLTTYIVDHKLIDIFIDYKNPSEEEMTMFEIESGINRHTLLLLLTLEERYNRLFLRKR